MGNFCCNKRKSVSLPSRYLHDKYSRQTGVYGSLFQKEIGELRIVLIGLRGVKYILFTRINCLF